VALSSRNYLGPLFGEVSLPLRFRSDDAGELAEHIETLARSWGDTLVEAGDALREAVDKEHSASRWAESITAVARYMRTRSRLTAQQLAAERIAEDETRLSDSVPDEPQGDQAGHNGSPDAAPGLEASTSAHTEPPNSDGQEKPAADATAKRRTRKWLSRGGRPRAG
jgi:hypothetical protein